MPLPLYAGLTIEEQLQVFEPTPKYTRKVIVSTNIAEASVTLEGVVYVIDTGFVKVSSTDQKKEGFNVSQPRLIRSVHTTQKLEWKRSL